MKWKLNKKEEKEQRELATSILNSFGKLIPNLDVIQKLGRVVFRNINGEIEQSYSQIEIPKNNDFNKIYLNLTPIIKDKKWIIKFKELKKIITFFKLSKNCTFELNNAKFEIYNGNLTIRSAINKDCIGIAKFSEEELQKIKEIIKNVDKLIQINN